ncbi:MAG: hypothetical protein ACI4UK_06460 [Floccifex sp.]
MEYSALLFGKNPSIQLFLEDDECKQIVQCLSEEELSKVVPCAKTIFVKMSNKPYVTLLSGLKAVFEENVLVIYSEISLDILKQVKEELSLYPAIYYSEDIQAFDTRLVMFCLQVAIESNFAISSYSQAVEALGSTPLKVLKK